jgi:hypothetical protein
VRVRPGERVFRWDAGRVFIPVGLNLAWPRQAGRAEDFRRWFIRLARAGGGAARIWLSSWGLPLEWDRAGHFDPDIAAALDEIFTAAQARDLALILVAENAHDLTARFQQHPYSRDRGGPLAVPVEFFRDGTALRLFKRRLTYLAARYGAYRSLLAWELLNEADEVWPAAKVDPGDQRAVPEDADRARAARRGILDWTTQLAQHLDGMDVHRHPLTLSLTLTPARQWPDFEKLPCLAFNEPHAYIPEAPDAQDDRAFDEVALLAAWAEEARQVGRAHRPFWLGEFGFAALGDPELAHGGPQAAAVDRNIRDREGVLLHNALMAGLASGQAGTPLTWWWDRYVDQNDLWKLFRGPALFAAALEDLAGREGPETLRPVSNVEEKRAAVRVLGRIGRTGACVWIHDRRSTWTARLERNEGPPPETQGMALRLPALDPGAYLVRWFDPWTAEQRSPDVLPIAPLAPGEAPKPVDVKVPRFKRDTALIIEPQSSPRP